MKPSPHHIRVRLDSALSTLPLSSNGVMTVFDHTHARKRALFAATRNLKIFCLREGFFLRGEKTEQRFLGRFITVQSDASFVWKNQSFTGELRLRRLKNGQCEVVNALDLERYLVGVVQAEVNPQWRAAALDAQVIAARGFALSRMQRARKSKKKSFDLEADVRDQVYKGDRIKTPWAREAVRRTRGQVLTPKEKPTSFLIPFFHSTCAGKTKLPQEVWGNGVTGYEKRIRCSYCQDSPRFTWKTAMSEDAIRLKFKRELRKKGIIVERATLEEIKFLPKKEKKREELILTFAPKRFAVSQKKWTLPLSVDRFRHLLGTIRIRSSDFSIASEMVKRPHRSHVRVFTFAGKGNGHGVGLCQYGAKKMASLGKTADAILKHYYPDAQLRTLY